MIGAGGAASMTGAGAGASGGGGATSGSGGASMVSTPESSSDPAPSAVVLFLVPRAVFDLGGAATSTAASVAVSTAVATPPAPLANHSRTVSAKPRLMSDMWLGTLSPRPSVLQRSRITLLGIPSSFANWLTRMPFTLAKQISNHDKSVHLGAKSAPYISTFTIRSLR